MGKKKEKKNAGDRHDKQSLTSMAASVKLKIHVVGVESKFVSY